MDPETQRMLEELEDKELQEAIQASIDLSEEVSNLTFSNPLYYDNDVNNFNYEHYKSYYELKEQQEAEDAAIAARLQEEENASASSNRNRAPPPVLHHNNSRPNYTSDSESNSDSESASENNYSPLNSPISNNYDGRHTSNTTSNSADIAEFRRIRREQDAEYELASIADSLKAKKKELEELEASIEREKQEKLTAEEALEKQRIEARNNLSPQERAAQIRAERLKRFGNM